ncbi:MAG: antitoxin [Deltaproteobacteria bacterium]|jgi:predicted DNA binding CopG/RHH family protein|nr:antitoxin [Deltaproteobacteria bacterium]
MSRFTKKSFKPLDKDEEELMDSIEQDQWRSVSNLYDEQQKAKIAAKNTLKKDKRINLRLSQRDYQQIQIKAVEEGMPYQTLIASILHKYLNDSLSTK